MELWELAAYAAEKYGLQEQHRWPELPGFSALVSPKSGTMLALLMQQWDSDTGTYIQRCDLKCGRLGALRQRTPWLRYSFRMKGDRWLGICLEAADPEMVFTLLDRAVRIEESPGATIILGELRTGRELLQADTPVPPRAGQQAAAAAVPEKIRNMWQLYTYKNDSFGEKCRIFCRQARYMEDYEDDVPWSGAFWKSTPAYHDLEPAQLRGYFTWRTRLRRGCWTDIPSPVACIYIAELLNGIGCSSPADALDKMETFEKNFVGAGYGDLWLRSTLRRWMLGYAVINGLPPAQAQRYADPAVLRTDAALEVLEKPGQYDDEQVWNALCLMEGEKPARTAGILREPERGKRLFAAVWRTACRDSAFFTACFGPRLTTAWFPLSGALYWEEDPRRDTRYELNGSRAFLYKEGRWLEESYMLRRGDRARLHSLMRAADRELHRLLKLRGGPRLKPGEQWAAACAEEAAAQLRRAEDEAARPKICLDLTRLDKIRADAGHTRDSLLTEADREEPAGACEAEKPETENRPLQAEAAPAVELPYPLQGAYGQVLLTLLRGENPGPVLRENHLMPTVAADAINGALLDGIGDSILECDGESVTLVEDYREDVMRYLEENS